jgi:hypothetical protein
MIGGGALYPESMSQELGRSQATGRDDEDDAVEQVWAQDARRARRRARTNGFLGAIPKILLRTIEMILDMFP